mgnify:CR=1 FL=1
MNNILSIKIRLLAVTTVALGLLLFALPASAATVSPDDLSAGDLIRGESFSAVYYYGEDGMRYVFPNDKTYFTWYENFDDVVWLTDSDMSTIQIGGNVTYKPGVRMIKINSDPTVYAVAAGGELRGIDSEEIAIELYGSNWNTMIDDVPDGFFSNYSIGSRLEFAGQFSVETEQLDAMDINDDKNLRPATEISVTDSGYDQPTTTISSGTAVRFTNTGSEDHAVSEFDGLWGSGTMNPGNHFTHYFNETGTWIYYSKLDDRNVFEGAIIVN